MILPPLIRRRILFSLMLGFLHAGCGVQSSDPKFTHENATLSDPLTPDRDGNPQASTFEKWKLLKKESKNSYEKFLLPLARKLLDLEKLKDREIALSRERVRGLYLLNLSLLEVISDLTSLQVFEIQELFLRAVKLQCQQTSSSCIGYRFLETDSQSSILFFQFAKRIQGKNEIKKELVRWAISLKGAAKQPSLGLELVSAFVIDSEAEPSGAIARVIAQEIDHILGSSKSKYEVDWFKRQIRNPQFFHKLFVSDRRLASKMVRLYLRNFDKKSFLKEGFQALRSQVPNSYQKALGSLQKDSNLRVFLKRIQKVNPLDALIFDLVFSERLTAQVASQLVRTLNLAPNDLYSSFEKYLEVLLIYQIRAATRIFKKHVNLSLSVRSLLPRAESGGVEISGIFEKEILSRLEYFKGFLVSIDSDHSSKLRVQVENLVLSTRRKILFAEYGHSLVLFRMLADRNFKLKKSYLERERETSDLFVLLYNEQLRPLLKYVDSKEEIKTVDLIVAYQKAIQLGIFEILGESPGEILKVMYSNLSKEALNKTNSSDNNRAQEQTEVIRTRLESNSAYIELRERCPLLTEKGVVSGQIFLEEIMKSPSLGLTADLLMTPLNISSSDSRKIEGRDVSKVSNAMNIFDINNADAVEALRLELGSLDKLSLLMENVISNHFRQVGWTSDQISEELKPFRDQRKRVHETRDEFISILTEHSLFAVKCAIPFFKKDYEVQDKLVEYERVYLEFLHEDMTKLQSLSPEDPEYSKILKRHEVNIGTNYRGQMNLSASGFVNHALDLNLRFAKYLSTGLQLPTKSLPAIAPKLLIDYGPEIEFGSDRLRLQADGKSWSSDPVAFHKDKNVFLKRALSSVSTGLGERRFVFWNSIRPSYLAAWIPGLSILNSLYRMPTDGGVTAEVILEYHVSLLEFLNLSPMAERNFNFLNVPALVGNASLLNHATLKWHERRKKVYSRDDFFLAILEFDEFDILGYNYQYSLRTKDRDSISPKNITYISAAKPIRISEMGLAKMVYRYKSEIESFGWLDKDSGVILSELYELASRDLRLRRTKSQILLGEIRKMITKIESEPLEKRLRIFEDSMVPRYGPLLSERRLMERQRLWQFFDSETGGCFKEKGCDLFSK